LHFLLGFQGDIGGVSQEALPGVGQLPVLRYPFPVRLRGRLLLPILLMLLERAGLVTAAQLAAKRRYAIVGAFAVAAVLTPPDAISQLHARDPAVAALRKLDYRHSVDRLALGPAGTCEPIGGITV
jgi:sec-independent protein translocase protein TatC